MPGMPLTQKLKLKPGLRAAIIEGPEGYVAELRDLPADVRMHGELDGTFDWVQVFVKSKAELDRIAPAVLAAVKPGGTVWFSFPKGISKIQTDLTRDKGWEEVRSAGLQWLTLISVNDTWSAFAARR